tara:strand:- start:200 stop:550 length:351 start_codon:yes stop_codon:yes gene_type:complete
MSVLTNAKKHFHNLNNGELNSMEVPEWGTTVYWKTGGLNFQSQSKVIELTNAGKTAEALVEMLILRAIDADGKKMFKQVEKNEIMREVDPDIILKVVTAINEIDDDVVGVDDALGN